MNRMLAILLAAFVAMVGGLSPSSGAEPGRLRVVAAALDDGNGVFRSEATRAAAIVAKRHPGATTTVLPAARRGGVGLADLREALVAAGRGADVAHDTLFLILTSHGSRAGMAVRIGERSETLTPRDLGAMLAESRFEHVIVVVSACFSGVFADALAGPERAVITAADADHPSFGCRAGRSWTFFGQAFFAEEFARAKTLRAAFDAARVSIARREAAEGYEPSNPLFVGGEVVLARLEGGSVPASTVPPPATAAVGCDLRPEPSPTVTDCEVFNGYAGGRLVGAFRQMGARFVAARGACPADWPRGRLVAPGKLAVDGAVYALHPDCRGSAKTSR